MRHGLELGLDADVLFEPGGAHAARRQAGDAGEFDHVLGAGIGQHLLEGEGGIAFARDGKGGTHLHGAGAQRLQVQDVLQRVDAAGGNQRNVLLVAGLLQELADLRQHHVKVEAAVVQIGNLGGTQVATGQARVLNHDGIGQTALFFPLLDDQLHAAGVGQDRDQFGLGVLLGQFGQVQRQAGADDHGIDTGFEGGPHVGGVGADRLHDVDGDQAKAHGQLAGAGDLAAQGLAVGIVDDGTGVIDITRFFQVLGLLHQVGMQAAQVYRGNGTDGTMTRHGAGQAASRNAHAHAALDHRQQRLAGQAPQLEAGGGGFFAQALDQGTGFGHGGQGGRGGRDLHVDPGKQNGGRLPAWALDGLVLCQASARSQEAAGCRKGYLLG